MGNIHSSLLSPSKSNIWLNCPYYFYVINFYKPYLDKIKNNTSSISYNRSALKGTIAHKVLEIVLLKSFFSDRFIDVFNPLEDEMICDICLRSLKDDKRNSAKEYEELLNNFYKLYSNGMVSNAYMFVDIIKRDLNKIIKCGDQPILRFETAIDCSFYAKNCIGTPDVFVFSKNHLIVYDYKYGKNDVPAEKNTQLMIYALGIIDNNKEFFDNLEEVKLVIVQPSSLISGAKKTNKISVDELVSWGENVLRPTAESACSENPKAVTGEWCRFCEAKPLCEKYHLDKIKKELSIDDLIENINYINDAHKMLLSFTDKLYKDGVFNSGAPKFPIIKFPEDHISFDHLTNNTTISISNKKNNLKDIILSATYNGESKKLFTINDIKELFCFAINNSEKQIIINIGDDNLALVGKKVTDEIFNNVFHERGDFRFNIGNSEYVVVSKDAYLEYKQFLSDYKDTTDRLNDIYNRCNRILMNVDKLMGDRFKSEIAKRKPDYYLNDFVQMVSYQKDSVSCDPGPFNNNIQNIENKLFSSSTTIDDWYD